MSASQGYTMDTLRSYSCGESSCSAHVPKCCSLCIAQLCEYLLRQELLRACTFYSRLCWKALRSSSQGQTTHMAHAIKKNSCSALLCSRSVP